MTKKEFVKKIIEVIQADEDTAIVGISGCSYFKTEIGRKSSRDNHLRVYMMGGFIMGIPLGSASFTFLEKSYMKRDEQGSPLYFSSQNEMDLLEERKAKITEIYDEKDYSEEALNKITEEIKEYLSLVRKCTQKKFGQLKAGNKADDEKKERNYQMCLFKKMLLDNDKEYVLFDVEFQSILEMNVDPDKIEKWAKEGHNFREKYSEETENGVVKVKCGKPDFIAVDENGFVIIEFKSNKEACAGGDADLSGHSKDFEQLISNKGNLILINELLERLRVMKEYKLINLSDKHSQMIEKVLNSNPGEINIDTKYILLTNSRNTKGIYLNIAKAQGCGKEKLLFVEESEIIN